MVRRSLQRGTSTTAPRHRARELARQRPHLRSIPLVRSKLSGAIARSLLGGLALALLALPPAATAAHRTTHGPAVNAAARRSTRGPTVYGALQSLQSSGALQGE